MAGAVQIIRTIVRGDPGPLEATVNHSYAVLGPDGATVKTLPWDDALWQAIRETREERPDLAKLERLGQHLYPLLGDVYEQAMNSDATTAVRIGLRLDSSGPAEELFSLPFELLRSSDTGRRLGATDQVLVCYQDVKLPRLRPDPQPDRPVGRLLFGWYGSDLQEVRDQQIRTIQQAFLDGGAQFIQAEDIFELSFQNLKAKLQENPNERGPACALHILCHTGPLGASEPGYGMVWADGIHPGARVAELLAEHADRLRLVVISSCLGSASAPNGPFRSVALELHKAGVEGVIGARSPITPESSVLLTRELYRSLLCGPSSLEQAFLTARRAIQSAWPGGLDHLGLQLFTHDFERWDTRPFTHRPYRGLERFRERDARFFFGRDREIAETVADVEALVATERPRLLIVAGGSGTGKSSLVLAGVLPELRRRGWTVAEVLRPSELDAERWMDQVASCTRAPRGEAGLVLVVDQFEEIFTTLDEATRCALTRHLWSVAGDPSSGVAVITTLRVDFIGRCGEIVLDQNLRLDHVAYDEAHRVFIERIGPAGLRRAIEEPARMVGLVLEAGLAARVAEDVESEAGALPLVQHAMDRLWHERKSRALIWPVGGVRGALEQHANAVYEALSEPERAAARRILLELVLVKGDRGAPVTKLRLTRDRVLGSRPEEEEPRVLDRLIDERLLVSEGSKDAEGGAWIEIAHEALITHWETFAGWLETARDMKAATGQIQGWADDPERFPFLNPQQLGYAHEVDAKYPGELSESARELIHRSEVTAEEERRREEERARENWRQAEEKRRATRRNVVALVSFLVAVGILTYSASDAMKRAEEEATRAWDRSLALAAEQAAEQPLLAAVLLREVARPREVDGWMELAAALSWTPLPDKVLGAIDGGVRFARFTPDGQQVLTLAPGGVTLWPVEGQGPGERLEGALENADEAEFSQDGEDLLLREKHGRRIQLWGRLPDGAWHDVWQREGATSAGLAPDGSRVVVVMEDKSAQVLDTQRDPAVARLKADGTGIDKALFSGAGMHVVTYSRDGRIRLWSLEDPVAPAIACEDYVGVQADWLSANEETFMSPSEIPDDALGRLDGPFFSPRGELVVAHIGGMPGQWRIWDLQNGTCKIDSIVDSDGLSFQPTEDDSDSPAFADDGRSVVFKSSQGDPWVWTAGVGLRRVFEALDGDQISNKPVISSDSRALLTCTADGHIARWSFDGLDSSKTLDPTLTSASPKDALDLHADLLRMREAIVGKTPYLGCDFDGPAFLSSSWDEIQFSSDGERVLTRGSIDGKTVLGPLTMDRYPKPLANLGVAANMGIYASYSSKQDNVVGIRGACKRSQDSPRRALEACRAKSYAIKVGRDGQPIEDVALEGQAAWDSAGDDTGVFFQEVANKIVRVAAPEYWSGAKDIPFDTEGVPGRSIARMISPARDQFLALVEGHLTLARISNPKQVQELRSCPKLHFAALSADGRHIAAACSGDAVETWVITENGALQLAAVIPVSEAPTAGEFSTTGDWLTLLGDSRSWIVRSDGSGAPRSIGSVISVGSFMGVFFSPHDHYLLTFPNHAGYLDGSPTVWRVDSADRGKMLRMKASNVASVGFSLDEARVRVLLHDATIQEFSVEDPTEPLGVYGGPWSYHGGVIEWNPRFSADLTHILTTSSTGFVREWPVRDHEQVLEALWRATPYCLPPEERRVHLQENEEESKTRFAACQARVKACQDPNVEVCSTVGSRYE